jgi:NTE family protein
MELFSSFGDSADFNLGGAVTVTPLGENAGEWRTLFSIGSEQKLITELYYPLDPAHEWFASGDVGYESQLFRLFVAGDPQAEYNTQRIGTRLRLGRNFGTWGRVQMQYERATGDANVSVGPPYIENYDFEAGKLTLGGAIDTLDNLYFTRRGMYSTLYWATARSEIGDSSDYDQVQLSYIGAKSWGVHTLMGGLAVASTLDNNAPLEARFRLGGFLRLSGLDMHALSGQHATLLRGMYRYQINNAMIPVYAGVSLELGNVWERRDDISFGDSRWASSLFLGADTFLGPAFVAYGLSEGGKDAVYLIFGNPWY